MNWQPVRFLLNGQAVCLEQVDPNQTVLQFLREQARLKGTKEGCAEGDCGACMVAVGQLQADETVHWQAVNSCIRLVSSIDGTALMTVDGLHQGHAGLHPVQQLMVREDGSQCGFCTPGFVMSMAARFQNGDLASLTRSQVDDVLSGNLCRCTGYRPIVDAALAMREQSDGPATELNRVTARALAKLHTLQSAGMASRALRPTHIDALLQARQEHPDAQLIAGCTDVGLWVTKHHRRFDKTLDVTSVTELQSISRHADGGLRIGAAVSLERAWNALVAHWPALAVFARRFASLPIRNSGTLGGNVANGSPIGDSMPVLMALGTVLTVASVRGERQIPLEDFYRGRQQTVMGDDEVLLWIDIAAPVADELMFAYKLSKRFDQDISAVCFAMNLRLSPPGADQMITHVRIGVGGMAATPMRAAKTEQSLLNAPFNAASFALAATTIGSEFSPITDMRASDAYRRHVIGALVLRAWREVSGDLVALEAMP